MVGHSKTIVQKTVDVGFWSSKDSGGLELEIFITSQYPTHPFLNTSMFSASRNQVSRTCQTSLEHMCLWE